ncbi:MAG: protein kinase, partial [Synergistaceae bacterium]|nr:protein kinase [Synergistaceae bacterium]
MANNIVSESGEYDTLEFVKKGENGLVEKVARRTDGATWIRRVYMDDKREVFSALASLACSGIPSIEKIEFSDRTTVIEQYIEGIPLSDALLAGRISRKDARSISAQLLEILACLGRKSIVHRDVKPDNILLSPNGRIFLIDFGIARVYRPNAARDTSL